MNGCRYKGKITQCKSFQENFHTSFGYTTDMSSTGAKYSRKFLTKLNKSNINRVYLFIKAVFSHHNQGWGWLYVFLTL